MAIVIETQLLEGLQKALNKSNETNTPVLFSKVVKTEAVSPLSFYQSGREQFLGERFFWQEPTSLHAIVGLGKIDRVQTTTNDRFIHIEQYWKTLLDNSVIQKEEELSAIGPVMFGGFSFDQEKSQSLLWDNFGDPFFYVPQFMVTNVKKQTYLTTNILCSPGDNIKRFIEVFENGQQLLRASKTPLSFVENTLVEKREIEPNKWKEQVAKAVEKIASSNIDKIVLARELRLFFKNNIMSDAILPQLLKEHGTSFIFSLESGSDCFIGATPERLVKKENDTILSTCLAGSIARGKDEIEDERLGQQLLNDPKNLKEHQYVVSMIQKAMQSVCHDVDVPSKPILMKIKHIQHLYTPVVAKSEQNVSLLDIVKKLHPTPALGGLPQQEAVKWIRENESLERGIYGAPLGWMDANGNGEFAVALRSALLQGKEASLFAGCGIVEDSNPEEEYKETWIKFQPMLNALGGSST
ncbi:MULTISPECIES: isochorismate synthase [Bacillus]|uniref:isochorismate synthase n=1 Tax=Bacillus TaxID=1386 RepID=UPI0002F2E55B|nr:MULTISPECIES: isochorismate synthase [Bacillus]